MSVLREENLRERANHAANILDAWGTALRGDWGSIDGRSSRNELAEISAYLRKKKDNLTLFDVGVCKKGPHGTPHWFGDGWGHDCWEEAQKENHE